MEKELAEIIEMIDSLLQDFSVPRNVRRALEEAKNRLRGSEELGVRISAAVYTVEAVSDDVNLPAHARAQLWAILSALEGIKND
ncbi:MAG: UPF0147 family protein [Candidatus Anstonellales archaeon]